MATRDYTAAVTEVRRENRELQKQIDKLHTELYDTSHCLNEERQAAGETFRLKESLYVHRLSVERDIKKQLQERLKGAERELDRCQCENRWLHKQMDTLQAFGAEQIEQLVAMRQLILDLLAEKQQMQVQLSEANSELQEKKEKLSVLEGQIRIVVAPETAESTDRGVITSSNSIVPGTGSSRDTTSLLATPSQEADPVAALQESLPAVNISSRPVGSSSSSSDDLSGPVTPDLSARPSDAAVSDDGSPAVNTSGSVTSTTVAQQPGQQPTSLGSSNSSSTSAGSKHKGLLGAICKCVSWCRKRFAKAAKVARKGKSH